MNVRTHGEGADSVEFATVYIPKRKSGHFLKKIEAYRNEETNSLDPEKSKPKNQKLIASVDDVREAMLRAFWTDEPDKMPQEQPQWVEAWLAVNADEIQAQESLAQFYRAVAGLGVLTGTAGHVLKFPERWVVLLYADQAQLLRLLDHADLIAEFRAAREPCTYFVETENREQAEWVEDLLRRARFDPASVVSVCILDHGINAGHPMIEPVLADPDMHAVDPNWGTHDHHPTGHGTRMAGIATYGDVRGAIDSYDTVEVRHRLESAKILPPFGQNPPELWGHMTAQGIYLAEIEAPHRKRVVCMAVTAEETRDRGQPTSWSGALDQLASGSDATEAGDDGVRRLIIVSAGNVGDHNEWKDYPDSNATNDIHDPAQSWNALSVGAYTNLTQIIHPDWQGYTAVAPPGGLAPCSTTSQAWASCWPVKPEIVLEGGNVAVSPGGDATDIDDLQLLSTWHRPHESHFAVFGDTSAATAHAAYLAAGIYAEYPGIWPETVRGLLVHSARWTEGMKAQFVSGTSKASYRQLLRSCGYGVPQLDVALRCLTNRLTLVSEATLQPFDKKDGRYGTNELHLYELPWPVQELRQLGDIDVQLRITLSYFVEPGPGEIGWRDRYRYASHGLRFELNNPSESRDEFIRRVNVQAREEEAGAPDTSSPSEHWVLGKYQRDVGSIHSDIWRGTAADLANSNLIAVRPSVGWWRERSHLGRWNRKARYSLIVSIVTPVENVDIYTPVANQVTTPVLIEIDG